MIRRNTRKIIIILLISFFFVQGAVFALATPPPGNDPTPPPGNDPTPPPGNDPTPPPGNDPTPPPGNDPTPPPGNDPTPPPGNDPTPPPGDDPTPPAPIPTVDIKANNSDGPIAVSYNTSANLTWDSSNVDSCQASGNWSGAKSISGTEATANLTSAKTYTISCTGPAGSASDSVIVNIGPATLLLIFSVIPPIGDVPLNNVDLRARIARTAVGDIFYQFDCTGDGTWEKEVTTSSTDYTAVDICSYPSVGVFAPKVKVTRAGLIIDGTTMIIVK